MQKNSVEASLLKIVAIIFSIVSIVLGILAFYQYSLLVGWVIGSLLSIAVFYLGILLINFLLKKIRNKILGFWFGFLRFYINILIHGLLFIGVIAINSLANGNPFMRSGIDNLMQPINFYTYLAGISIIWVSIISLNIFKKKGQKDDTKT